MLATGENRGDVMELIDKFGVIFHKNHDKFNPRKKLYFCYSQVRKRLVIIRHLLYF